MFRPAKVALFVILAVISVSQPRTQEAHPLTVKQITDLKTLVIGTEAKSDSVIVIPPVTSFTSADEKKVPAADAVDLPIWRTKEEGLNGLQSTDLPAWHLVVAYDQFDEDGDNVNSGVFEEYWASPQKYKRSYKSDRFNQTDYGTPKGLYRQGDQKFPDGAQSQVRSAIVDPFSYPPTLQGFRGRSLANAFNGYNLQCVLIETNVNISAPTEYCFETGGSILRYSRGDGWFQTVYNQIFLFQGRNLAREVDVTDGGKPYLKLRVEKIELLSPVDEANFVPPASAVGPVGDRVSGVIVHPIDMSAHARFPASLQNQHFTVGVEIVIGKDGHVIGAHAISGPREAYKACEDASRKWVFKPYLVLDKPVEVEQKVECSNN
jgi:hypothetical protein